MRWATGLVAAPVAGLLLVAGCSGGPAPGPTAPSTPAPSTPTSASGTPAGCGLVRAAAVTGLIGAQVHATLSGSLGALRGRHRSVSCRSAVPGHPERYVTVRADYHPAPLQLPSRACSAGWVYAGTPTKYAPACQDTVDGHGRTQLLVRWQPYVVRVTVGRSDRQWGGDPELALAMSRTLAQRLGVEAAAGNG